MFPWAANWGAADRGLLPNSGLPIWEMGDFFLSRVSSFNRPDSKSDGDLLTRLLVLPLPFLLSFGLLAVTSPQFVFVAEEN